MIEIMVVLAVLGLSLAFVATRGPGRSERLELDGAARDVAGAMRFARSRAIALDRPVGVSIDATARTIHVDGTPDRRIPFGISVAGTARAIVFAGDGSTTGGAVELSGRTRRVRVMVDWLSGRVSLTEDAPV